MDGGIDEGWGSLWKTGTGFVAHLKLIGNGSQSRFYASHTLSTKSATIPVALMKGRPRIKFTATSGPAATRREVALPSLVVYGR